MKTMLQIVVALAVLAAASTSQAYFADDFNGGTAPNDIGGVSGWAAGYDEDLAQTSLIYDAGEGTGFPSSQAATNTFSTGTSTGQLARNVTADIENDQYEMSVLIRQATSNSMQVKLGSNASQLSNGMSADGQYQVQARNDQIFAGTNGGGWTSGTVVDTNLNTPLVGGTLPWDWRSEGFYMLKVVVDFNPSTGQPTQVEMFLGNVDDNNDNLTNPTFVAGQGLQSVGLLPGMGNINTATASDLAVAILMSGAATNGAYDNFVSGVVPEPASLGLALLGSAGLMMTWRRRRKS